MHLSMPNDQCSLRNFNKFWSVVMDAEFLNLMARQLRFGPQILAIIYAPEPGFPLICIQDYRHSMMNISHGLIGGASQDRACQKAIPTGTQPSKE